MLFVPPFKRSFTLRGMFILLTLAVVFIGGYRGFTRLYRYNVSQRQFLNHPELLQITEPEPGRVVLSAAKDRPISLVLYRMTARQPTASEYERVLIPLPPPHSDWLCFSTEFQVQAFVDQQGSHLQIDGQEYYPNDSELREQLRANPFAAISLCGTCLMYERQLPAAMLTRVPLTKPFELKHHLHSRETYCLFATRENIAALLPERVVIHD